MPPDPTPPGPSPGPFDSKRPFTRADAVAAGIAAKVLRTSRFRRIFRGVYIDADVELGPKIQALAALVLHPRTAFASHQTGASLRGLPVPACDRAHVTVFKQEQRVQRAGIACHVACAETRVERVKGIRTSSPLDLFIELAGVLSLIDLVVVGDAMVRLKLFTVHELRKFCANTRRWHSRRARLGAEHVRAEVDSPMESRLRMLLVLAGLPEPTINHKIVDGEGRVLRRFDLSYPSAMTIVEYDGRQHAEDDDQWSSDIDRREEIDEHDWRLIVITHRGVYRTPEQTIMRVARVLRKRGMRIGPLRDDWRVHFPVR